MSPEERESIINEAVERALLKLPDVWANLVIDHKAMRDTTEAFYKENKEFKGFEKSVASIIADIDGKHPTLSYEEKLKKSIPGIRERISQTKQLGMNVIQNPDRVFDNGAI